MVGILLLVVVSLSEGVPQEIVPSFIIAFMGPHGTRNFEILTLKLRPIEWVLPLLEVALDGGAHLSHPLVSHLFFGYCFKGHSVLGLEFLDSFRLLGLRSFGLSRQLLFFL